VEPELRALHAQAELEVPEALHLTGCEEHFHSILKNLVTNARDALADTPAGHPRRLRITAWREAERVWLTVRDSGPGIAEQDRERIFEPFFSTRPEKGVGLGLGVVRKLVGLYAGTIHVGGAPGQGACFTLSFPASAP
jgi:signal transduction histidine kinase